MMKLRKACLAMAISAISAGAVAQDNEGDIEEVLVTGIRASLASALEEKREATNLVEVIKADDIGKLPDQNLAEVLENVTGVQITRTAGVGTGVQIRGTNSNQVLINGVQTVASGNGRSGINFEDVNASMISAVQVTKASEAKTIEGSVGGTVNLETIRPLDLKQTLGNIRIQGEQSSLSTDDITPRLSGAYGDSWEVGDGELGFVISGSYTEQSAVSFRPRADRDNIAQASDLAANGIDVTGAPDEWQGIQFLLQEQEKNDYVTSNVATSLEWAPNDNLKLYTDFIYIDQERSRDQYRMQASGVSSFKNYSLPTSFENVDYGSIDGQDLPSYAVATSGYISATPPAPGEYQTEGASSDNPNIRATTETNSRVTTNKVFTIGGEWNAERWTLSGEYATSSSDTETPYTNTTLNFLNPNSPLVADVRFDSVCQIDASTIVLDSDGNPESGDCLEDSDGNTVYLYEPTNGTYKYSLSADQRANAMAGNVTDVELEARNQMEAIEVAAFGGPLPVNAIGDDAYNRSDILNDNATPLVYDLRGNSLAFGIDDSSVYAPTTAQMLDVNNYVLDQVQVGRTFQSNSNDSMRMDFSFNVDDFGLTSVDAGIRWNKVATEYRTERDNLGGFSKLRDAPPASDFASVIVTGPDNYGDADGRDLFVKDFLQVDPNASFSNGDAVVQTIEDAIVAWDSSPDTLSLSWDDLAYYDIEEATTAFYAQANFESGIFRGNAGFRFVRSEVDSTANTDSNGDLALNTVSGSYSFLLPRLNLIAQPSDEVIIRFGYGKDISRPGFNRLNSAISYGQNENTTLEFGNPSLQPETVNSFDLSTEWYFAPSAVASIGYFYKDRTNLFGTTLYSAAVTESDTTTGGYARETDSSCPGGGIWNPEVIPNQFGDSSTQGLCVDYQTDSNDPAVTNQSGVELAVQYDLSSFEDSLGWASGFGFMANYTAQKFSGGSAVDTTGGRGLTVLGDISAAEGLLDHSETAYNFTAYYEKYGVSARMRYTWRDAFRTEDFAGGASTNSTLSLPVVDEARGQLNASISYDVTDSLNLGIEAVNLTEEKVVQHCATISGAVCFVGYPDRRITFGGSYRF